MTRFSLWQRFLLWRVKQANEGAFFIYIASILVAATAALAAILMKNAVSGLKYAFQLLVSEWPYLQFALPLVGVALVAVFVFFLFHEKEVGHGIPKILYAIGYKNAEIPPSSMYSSLLTSIITVGFGGSVGLEGPSASTGGAIGSNVARYFNLSYTQTVLLLGCGATGAIAAIFNTPIAAVVFSLEILLLDLSMASLIPLLLSSITGITVSYFLLGQRTIWAVNATMQFALGDFLFYLLAGVAFGMISLYFIKLYIQIEDWFDMLEKQRWRVMVGGVLLGLLVFVLPPLYGEGYEAINACLHGDITFLNEAKLFELTGGTSQHNAVWVLLLLVLLKPIATSLTFGAGGVGGVFAPSLFLGANAGLLFALLVNMLGMHQLSPSTFALLGMAGVLSGLLHGPLTAVFLIADVTGGYGLIVPLMIVSATSYATARRFVPYSIYTHELARSNKLISRDKNKTALSAIQLDALLETDFTVMRPTETLGEFTRKFRTARRNIFPVVSEDGQMLGYFSLNDMRLLIFRPDMYDKVLMKDIMRPPEHWVNETDSIEEIAQKIQASNRYNIVVLNASGKYVGYVSRANLFSTYQRIVKKMSNG